ncbi:hypothetical protein AAMO2058_000747200 [Amorphochlora amoebiformis]
MSGVESIDGLLAKFSGLRAELLRLQESPEVQLAIPQIQQSLNWALTLAEKAIASQKERKSKGEGKWYESQPSRRGSKVESLFHPHRQRMRLTSGFDPKNPTIKQEILLMITQFLKEEGFTSSMMVIQDEARMKMKQHSDLSLIFQRMQGRILGGEWTAVDKLYTDLQSIAASSPRVKRSSRYLIYEVYKQQFLELIHRQEVHKAFAFLKKKLKPLQVNEAASFKDWLGIHSSREQLAERIRQFTQTNRLVYPSIRTPNLPPNRLVHLLQQAVAFQMHFSAPTSPSHTTSTTSQATLLKDYTTYGVPRLLHKDLMGHTMDVKAVCFLGDRGESFATGSSDKSIRIWDTETGSCKSIVSGHASKIWDIASDSRGQTLVSGSANGCIKVWSVESAKPLETHFFHNKAVFSVDMKRSGSHYISGGFDAKVRIVDIKASKVTSEFSGHSSLISSVALNQAGTLLISGSRDCKIKFWDSISGSCIQTLSYNLGEVTSIAISENDTYVLSSSKDNSVRVWDVRTGKCLHKLTGCQNTWKNFIRSSFGPNEELVLSGSEDGFVYIWDLNTGKLVENLQAHDDVVYAAQWNPSAGLMVSCAHDGTVKTWQCES